MSQYCRDGTFDCPLTGKTTSLLLDSRLNPSIYLVPPPIPPILFFDLTSLATHFVKIRVQRRHIRRIFPYFRQQ